MRPALARRCRMRRCRTGGVVRQCQVEVGTSTCDSSQSIIATRSARSCGMLPGLGRSLAAMTHIVRPVSRAHAARHRPHPRAAATEVDPGPGLGMQEVVDDRRPGRCGRACRRCSWRSVWRGRRRRQSASVRAVRPPRRSSPPDRPRSAGPMPVVGIGTGTGILHGRGAATDRSPMPDQASLRWPSRPTASCPLTRTLHTPLTPAPPVRRSLRNDDRHPTAQVPPIPPATSWQRVMRSARRDWVRLVWSEGSGSECVLALCCAGVEPLVFAG